MAAERIIGFLNQTAGRHFKTTDANCEPVIARFKEGYTESDCRAVIVRRWRAWKDDDKMIGYMRPATLFNRTKFNQYAGEIEPEEE